MLWLLALLPNPGFGQQELVTSLQTGEKSFQIPRMDEGSVVIDGLLDEETWGRAALISDFHQVDPVEFAEPSQRTEVRVFYTENALYVGAKMYEENPDLIDARIMRQGQGLRPDDIFMLILDPYMDRRNGYIFETNANGIRVEGIYQNVEDVDRSWEGIWQVRTSIDEEGWVAEMRIPLQTLSFNPDTDSWGMNFRRSIRRVNENIGWVSRNRQMNPSIAGTAVGLQDLRQGLGLDIIPYVLMRQDKVFGPDGSTSNALEPQLDIFYKITPQLNAALTLNTDFSAADVDSRQVNLTRFNLFFPERRDFFLRDADIFEFGQIGSGGFSFGGGNPTIPNAAAQNGRPFFSRRIGLSPDGSPVDINAGGKLSGRAGDWNLGSLLVNQAADRSGSGEQTVFVGRAARNVLAESQVGMIMTHGDTQSSESNSLMGADFRYRNSRLPGNRVVQAGAWYQQSDSPGVNGENASYGFNIQAPNNEGPRGAYWFKRIQRNFNPALGYVNLTNMQDHGLDFGSRKFFAPRGYFRSAYFGFDGYRSESLDTMDVISQSYGLRLSIDNNTGDNAFFRILESRENLLNNFTIHRASDGSKTVVIPAGDYIYNEYMAGVEFGDQRPISGRIAFRGGEYFDGNRLQSEFRVNWRPRPGYQLSLDYRENDIRLDHGDFVVRQYTVDSQISFSPILTWSTLVQYDTVSELVGINSRLHWIPEAGQQAFLVLNYGLENFDKTNQFSSLNWDLSLKMNYTFRY